MNRKILSRIILILILPLFCAVLIQCIHTLESDGKYEFKMYYLKTDSVTYSEAAEQPLSKLKLHESAFISAGDIQTFTVVYMDDNPIRSYRIKLNDSFNKPLADEVRPFVIKINGNRFALAEYWPAMFSYLPKGILLEYHSFNNEFWLMSVTEAGGEKLRDPLIVETLQNLGVNVEYKEIGGD